MNRLRTVAAATALLGPLTLAGCGITPTGVVESGSPATVIIGPRDRSGVVYFVTPDDRLLPSSQVDSPPSSPTGTLLRLLAGPGPQERAAGLGTRLPVVEGDQTGPVGVTLVSPGTVEVRVPFKIGDLSRLARRQLVCTVEAAAGSEAADVQVMLRGPDATGYETPCAAGR
ncbi:hypothetical protein [Streptomyces sp. cmx-4-9]|uniref:hypothetical protein n=1 Tax=Streptomyces sp. cmx-4-9 TaxID=2790941 RepID=UPI0039800A6C